MLHFRTHRVDDVVLIEFIVPGICDGPEIEEMSDELHEILGRCESKRMVIDLARVRFIASRALSLLLSLKQLVDIHHGELVICGLQDQLRQVFRMTGQDRFLTLMPDREQALESLGVATTG